MGKATYQEIQTDDIYDFAKIKNPTLLCISCIAIIGMYYFLFFSI